MVKSKSLWLLIALCATGCHHCQRCEQPNCSPAEGCGERTAPQQAPQSCSGAPAAAPMAAPAAAPYDYPPQAPMYAAAPTYGAAPAYAMAAPVEAAPVQESGVALGMGVFRLPIPFPKLMAVPKPPRQRAMHAVLLQQQAPMMQAPMIMQAPMMQAPIMQAPIMQAPVAQQAPAAPAAPQQCLTQDNEILANLLLQQRQRAAPSAAPSGGAAAISSDDDNDEDEVAERTRELESRVDRLIEKLEGK